MSSLEKVKKEIEDAEIVFGKKKGVTKLIAVSKTKPMDQIKKTQCTAWSRKNLT